MRRVLPGLLMGLLLAGLLQAAEPDGAVALPFRWTGPRGAASGSFRSLALPVVSEVEEAWRIGFDRVEAGPVHWDGIGYVVGVRAAKTLLVAFDLLTGAEVARTEVAGFRRGTALHVWGAQVHLQTGAGALRTYQLVPGAFRPRWTYRGRNVDGAWQAPRDPLVFEDEIYCRVGADLVRLTADRKVLLWTRPLLEPASPPHAFSNLALLGDHLFLASIDRSTGELRVEVRRRRDGVRVAGVGITTAEVDAADRPLDLSVRERRIFLRSGWPLRLRDATVTGALVPFESAGDGVRLADRFGMFSFHLPPTQHPSGAIVLGDGDDGREWMLWRDDRFLRLASQASQPDLFRDAVPPTVCGEVACFGSWAADLETKQILWRLPVKRVTRPVVPADRLVLVVDDGKTLRAFRGRGRG